MENIDWNNLGFGYQKTDYNIRCSYKNGTWGELRVCEDENIQIHMGATCLHYGQEVFEGLKAFKGRDGQIRIFRMNENAKRMQDSCRGTMMAVLPVEKFEKAIFKAVSLNKRFVPPYESGASLYIRPILIGTAPKIGVKPSDEYEFIVFVMPVGPYFKGGFQTTPFVIMREFDRSAPLGMGRNKVGGNYAAGMVAVERAHEMGYSNIFYLDSAEKKYIDECGAANFFGIKNNTYITPKSNSILPSITNKSLMTLAEEMGLQVECRQVPVEELSTFEETGACGTAAVISPIERIDDYDKNITYTFSKDGKPGMISEKLYHKLLAIQYGDEPDTHQWVTIVE